MQKRKLGIAVIGIGGAVGTTMAAGIELLRLGLADQVGLPLAGEPDLIEYSDIEIGGWDLIGDNLAVATATHEVLTPKQTAAVQRYLENIEPWPALGDLRFVESVDGRNKIQACSHRAAISKIRKDIKKFKEKCENVVVLNLASTERLIETDPTIHGSLTLFESALDSDSPAISPAMIYAYSAIAEQAAYANFTPSIAAEIPALTQFAEQTGVPIAGKDGKTGQTFIKTVLAPALKERALYVEGWYSTNLLGNRDGLALSNEGSLASKLKTKSSVLDDILGYEVADHIVDIRYYRPRGDNKEAWDNIDFRGFLGADMQIKVNFLCKDSILAAPLAIEIARCLDLAVRRGESGIQEQLAAFFKMPMSRSKRPEHAFHKQTEMLRKWLHNE